MTPPTVPAPTAQPSGPVDSGKPATAATAPKAKQVDATKSKAPVAKTPAPAGAPTTPAASLPPPAVQAPAARPTVPAAPALDLTSLQQRLRETHAIGVFTKLSLKNQVDDLLTQLKAFHRRQSQFTLADLRQRYDLLLLKVLSLLQDGDPPLAAAISSSREAIWGILSDPDKFARMQLG